MSVAGDLTLSELRELERLRKQRDLACLRIGELELEKAQLLLVAQSATIASEALMFQVASRIGIPQGVAWTITPDGVVHTQDEP